MELKVFEAEQIVTEVQTLALPHYPGWQATRSGTKVNFLRTYGGLGAVPLPEANTLSN